MLLIHISNTKIKKIKNIKQTKLYKPRGLWYAPNKEWLEWSEENMKKKYKYIYMIELYYTTLDKPDKNKVLQVTDDNIFDQLVFQYGYISGPIVVLDWIALAKKFGGIEFIPLLYNRAMIYDKDVSNRYEEKDLRPPDMLKGSLSIMTFLYSFDISSGCVWQRKAVKKFKLI